jgi:predicted alpha/beta-hydrolase family hydrolase
LYRVTSDARVTSTAFAVPGDGISHAATLYRSTASPDDRLLVLAHGAGAGQAHPFMVRYARGLAQRGIAVATFDFPYTQTKRKSPDRAPVLEDAFRRVVAGAAKHPDVTAGNVFIGGKSMGGRMATHLAAAPDQWPATTPPLAGVIVLGYPLNPPGPSKRSPDRVSHLARIEVPLLIVQGTRDTFGGPAEIRGAAPHAQVLEVPTGDHSFAVLKSSGRTQEESDAVVMDAIARFILV